MSVHKARKKISHRRSIESKSAKSHMRTHLQHRKNVQRRLYVLVVHITLPSKISSVSGTKIQHFRHSMIIWIHLINFVVIYELIYDFSRFLISWKKIIVVELRTRHWFVQSMQFWFSIETDDDTRNNVLNKAGLQNKYPWSICIS